jgi:hypothetical protein
MSNSLDFFQDDSNNVQRLVGEWKTYGKLIVAYDFDNTVFDYSKKNNDCSNVIKLIRECALMGFHLVVFTSCNNDRLPDIAEYLIENRIPFDAINETPDFIPFQGRKVYYNILLDDRAGLSAAMKILWNTIYNIRGIKATDNLKDIG